MEFLQNLLFFAQTKIGEGAKEIAEGTPQGTAEPSRPRGTGGWEMLIFLGVFFVIMWFLLIRPQQKKAKKHQEFLKTLKSGDSVVTANGFIGKVVNISGEIVSLELAKDVKVKILKSQIANYFEDTGGSQSFEKK